MTVLSEEKGGSDIPLPLLVPFSATAPSYEYLEP